MFVRTWQAKQNLFLPDELAIEESSRMRRRGVELKLHLGDAPPEVDRALVRNIVGARSRLKILIGGKAFVRIAEVEDTSKRRAPETASSALSHESLCE